MNLYIFDQSMPIEINISLQNVSTGQCVTIIE
jgi:hypothetical protein